MRPTYVETVRSYHKEGFEWVREYGIDRAIYATNRTLRRWGVNETVTFIRFPTPKVDFYTTEAYSYAIGVESTDYPLAYISLQHLSLVCHWGYLCTFPLPLPSKGKIHMSITLSAPFPLSLPTALAVATFATHFPIRNWAGSVGVSRHEPAPLFVASLILFSDGLWKYEIKIMFGRQRAWCVLRKWRYMGEEEVLNQFSGGYNKVVGEAIRLAALLTL